MVVSGRESTAKQYWVGTRAGSSGWVPLEQCHRLLEARCDCKKRRFGGRSHIYVQSCGMLAPCAEPYEWELVGGSVCPKSSSRSCEVSTETLHPSPYQDKTASFIFSQHITEHICICSFFLSLPHSCNCISLQLGPPSEKAEISTAAGPPDQCSTPLLTCKAATCVVVTWEVGF